MSTEIRIGLSGDRRKELKSAIDAMLATKGLKRRRGATHTMVWNVSPVVAVEIAHAAYEIEGRFLPTHIQSFSIDSPLSKIGLRRSRYRSI